MADTSHISLPNVEKEAEVPRQETHEQTSIFEIDRQAESVSVLVNDFDRERKDDEFVKQRMPMASASSNTPRASNRRDDDWGTNIGSPSGQPHLSLDHDERQREPPVTVSTPKMSQGRGEEHQQSGNQTGDQDGNFSSRFQSTDTDSDTGSSTEGRTMADDRFDDFEDSEDTIAALGLEAWREWLHIEHDPDHRDRNPGPPEEPLYPQGLVVRTECYVCFEENDLRRRLCCDFPVCDGCLKSYLVEQIIQANVNIECININCNSYIHRSEISAQLPPKYKMKFYKFLIDANIDPSVKTCPRCSSGHQIDKGLLKKRKVMRSGLFVTCKRCGLEWCFTCHAPWHKNLTCKDYRKGDVLLKDWAREFHYGQLNAQQCPKCKIFIQRSLGCDHMTCSRCDTSFCYRCGENYRGFKLLGNHFSRLSPFGCRYNFMPEAPHLRRLIRGAVLGGRVLGGIALSGLVVAAGAFLLGISVIALPAWGGYKLHKRRRYRQRLRANRKYAKQNMALRNLQAKKATETAVPVLPMPAHDSSDSTADDSSEDMRDGLVVGLQLPDAQRVEVLVHQAISPSNHHDEGGASGGGREIVTDTSIVLTDVQEVMDKSGHKTVVANFYSKPKDDKASISDDSFGFRGFNKDKKVDIVHSLDLSSRQGQGLSAKERKVTSTHNSGNGEVGCVLCEDKDAIDCCHSKHSKRKPDAQHCFASQDAECQDEKERKQEEAVLPQGTRSEENGKWSLKDQKETFHENVQKCESKLVECVPCNEMRDLDCVEKSDKKTIEKDPSGNRKCSDQKDADPLGKESTNGCFGNIFSKKISVIQLTGKRSSDPQSEAQKPLNAFCKSSSWDKGQEKCTTMKMKTGVEAGEFTKEKQVQAPAGYTVKTEVCEKGVLLQDCVVLAPPYDFSSKDLDEGDTLSVDSFPSVDCIDVKDDLTVEQESSCLSASNSFQGSNLSCDIVTYL